MTMTMEAATVQCGRDGCGGDVDRVPANRCGDGSGGEHGCGGWFCGADLFVPPERVKVRGGGLCGACLAVVVVRTCEACSGDDPCEHDRAAAPLADIIHAHLKTGEALPSTRAYLLAHALLGTVGPGPYVVATLHLLPEEARGTGAGALLEEACAEYVGAFVANGWVVMLRDDGPADVLGRLVGSRVGDRAD
jgi:hypothetical protein